MASHLSTPESILTAPERDEDWLVWHRSPSRAMRRHWKRFPLIFQPGKDGLPTKHFHTVNKPYEKVEK